MKGAMNMAKAMALPIDVYKNKSYERCSNGGITERFDRLLLVCPEGYIEIDEANKPDNLVVLKEREIFGSKHYHIEPARKPDDNCVGWMAGGAYAASSDSRFTKMLGDLYAAISVHDRQETQKEYDLLSR